MDDRIARLGQYMTPNWAAAELVAHYFGDLTPSDRVLEPSCGRGAFLQAIPDQVLALGVEIDPELAALARRNSGRPVIVGDFRMVDLPFRPTAIIGNPPFQLRTIEAFLERADVLMEEGGRVGLILPTYTFQTSNTALRIAERWQVRQDMLPRDLYDGLTKPLCFALFTKGRARGLVNFALYHELQAVKRLQARYQALLASGEGSAWAAVTRAALEALGGRADLQRLYREIEGHRPTPNQWWREKVRQVLQRIAIRVDDGIWALPSCL